LLFGEREADLFIHNKINDQNNRISGSKKNKTNKLLIFRVTSLGNTQANKSIHFLILQFKKNIWW